MDSMNSALYLRPNIMAEPLVDGWYAWTHLIPPATAARNLTERHLKIMESYLECSEAHDAAVQDPKMVGGPYMDFNRNREDDVRALRDRTIQERNDLIELSRSIDKLDAVLRAKANGFSLEGLYAEVPPCLQGFVEIVYDLNNQPSFRLIEPLLYRSALYDDTFQSVMLAEISAMTALRDEHAPSRKGQCDPAADPLRQRTLRSTIPHETPTNAVRSNA